MESARRWATQSLDEKPCRCGCYKRGKCDEAEGVADDIEQPLEIEFVLGIDELRPDRRAGADHGMIRPFFVCSHGVFDRICPAVSQRREILS